MSPKKSQRICDQKLAGILDGLSEYYRNVHTAWADEREPETIALWTMHTWLVRNPWFTREYLNNISTVYLYITSHEADSGKTTLARGIALVTPGAVICTPSVSRITRFLTNPGNETLIIDQFQDLFKARSTDAEQLNLALANGHAYGVSTLLTGKDGSEESYSTFFPKAFLGLATHTLNTEISSRSIHIRLSAANGEQYRQLRAQQREYSTVNSGKQLAKDIRTWLANDELIPMTIAQMMYNDHTRTLNDGTELINREADNWQMLFALADLAGGKYPALIRDVAKDMSSGGIDPCPSDSERIDVAIIKLARNGKLPIENWQTGKSPLPSVAGLNLTNADLGWVNGSRPRPKNNGILPTVTLLVNAETKTAELRILVGDIKEITTALDMSRHEFTGSYKRANRLHHQGGDKIRDTMPLPFRKGGDKKVLIAVDFTDPVFGSKVV